MNGELCTVEPVICWPEGVEAKGLQSTILQNEYNVAHMLRCLRALCLQTNSRIGGLCFYDHITITTTYVSKDKCP